MRRLFAAHCRDVATCRMACNTARINRGDTVTRGALTRGMGVDDTR